MAPNIDLKMSIRRHKWQILNRDFVCLTFWWNKSRTHLSDRFHDPAPVRIRNFLFYHNLINWIIDDFISSCSFFLVGALEFILSIFLPRIFNSVKHFRLDSVLYQIDKYSFFHLPNSCRTVLFETLSFSLLHVAYDLIRVQLSLKRVLSQV